MGPHSFGHLQTSERRHRAHLPQQAVWINSADDEGHYWGAVGLYKILRKSGTLSEWICTDLVKINQLSSKAIRFFFGASSSNLWNCQMVSRTHAYDRQNPCSLSSTVSGYFFLLKMNCSLKRTSVLDRSHFYTHITRVRICKMHF